MKISLSPQRCDEQLTVIRSGADVLIINDEPFDFSGLPDGATIPAGVVPCKWITGPVERIGGELHLTLTLPHGPDASEAVAFPLAIINPPIGGMVSLPVDPAPVDPRLVSEGISIEAETSHVDG